MPLPPPQLYASREDLTRLGLRKLATAGLADIDLDAALLAASEFADGYLRAQFRLPLSAWGADLRRHVAAIAAWDILGAQRGFNPDAPGNDIWLTRYEQAIEWLRDIARGVVTPSVEDATPTRRDGAPRIATTPPRGW